MSVFKLSNVKHTKREALTKSIKLEAVPEEATVRAIETQELREKDETLLDKAHQMEPYIDLAVKAIATKGLENISIDMAAWKDAYDASKEGESAEKKAYREFLTQVENEVVTTIENSLPNGMTKIDAINTPGFFNTIIPEFIQKSDMSAAEKESAITLSNEMSACTPVMKKFLINRITILKTTVPKRVIENFEIYLNNIPNIQKFLDSEYADEFLKDWEYFQSLNSVEYYRFCLTAEGIEGYNKMVNGICNENGIVTKGYNMFINELNIKNRNDKSYNGDFYRKISPLYQQILMPKEKQFSINRISSDDEVRETIREVDEKVPQKALFMIYTHIANAKPEGIMVSGRMLHNLSHIAYNDHQVVPKAVQDKIAADLETQMEQASTKSEKDKIQKHLDTLSTYVDHMTFSVSELMEIVDDKELYKKYANGLLEAYHAICNQAKVVRDENILGTRKIFGKEKAKIVVKDYMDTLIAFRSIVNIIKLKNVSEERADIFFYDKLDELTECLNVYTEANNLCRNYLTAKPKDLASERLACFGAPGKLNAKWWKATDAKLGAAMNAMMKKDGKFYFVMTSPNAKPVPMVQVDENTPHYECLSYKTMQKAFMMLPKTVFSKEVLSQFTSGAKEVVHPAIPDFTISRKQYEIYRDKLFASDAVKKKGITAKANKRALATMIDMYKEVLTKYDQIQAFHFNLRNTEDYENIGVFMDDVDVCLTKAEWVYIDKKTVDEAIEAGQLLSFLITNRTMYNDYGKKTSYAETFLYMMSDENMETLNFRLNSRPQFTFRPAVLPYTVTHKKGSILLNKKDKNGNFIRGDLYVELYTYFNTITIEEEDLSEEARELLPYCVTKTAETDIIKDQRYAEDKYFISMSYKLNAKVPGYENNTITDEILENMKDGYKTLSVVRGTTDLIYCVLYDENGKPIMKKSLNVIGNVDYQQKLKVLSNERNIGKSDNWNYELTVKNIKNAYIGFAISEILKIATENDAIIVVEKLNDEFKNKMQMIDNQVYKAFEAKLESRLLDYRRKDIKMGEAGSISNPMQMGKTYRFGAPMQNGILFHINASYTNNMCPFTGFVNLFDFANIRTQEAKREFLKKFDSIEIKDDQIVFTFDYKNFKVRDKVSVDDLDKTSWKIYCGKPRTDYDREKKHYVYNPTPADEAIAAVSNIEDTNLAKADISKKQAEILFNLFYSTIRTSTVKKCKEVDKEYYSSPATASDNLSLSVAEVAAENMAKKMWYHMNISDDKFNDKKYLSGWLNYAQKAIA